MLKKQFLHYLYCLGSLHSSRAASDFDNTPTVQQCEEESGRLMIWGVRQENTTLHYIHRKTSQYHHARKNVCLVSIFERISKWNRILREQLSMVITIPDIGVRSILQHHFQAACVLLSLFANSQVYCSHPFTTHQVRACTLWEKQLHRSTKEDTCYNLTYSAYI